MGNDDLVYFEDKALTNSYETTFSFVYQFQCCRMIACPSLHLYSKLFTYL
jgi:hypothetical protein